MSRSAADRRSLAAGDDGTPALALSKPVLLISQHTRAFQRYFTSQPHVISYRPKSGDRKHLLQLKRCVLQASETFKLNLAICAFASLFLSSA